MQKNIWIAAKYLRLSIEDGDKAESESIVNQSILIDNYMKSTSDITIVETFKDDGFSGTDFKRPGFQAMLKAIENKEINCTQKTGNSLEGAFSLFYQNGCATVLT